MKFTGQKLFGFLNNPDPNIKIILIYGPDQGLVRERADQLAKNVVEILDDPFRVTELSGRDITADPARLNDEAAAMSMIGGDKVIRVRDVSDAITKIIKPLFELSPNINLILVEAGPLTPRSSLRKLFETSKTGASLACYTDEARDIARIVQETLSNHNLRASRDATQYLIHNLGGDRRITRNELEKLCLYAGQSDNDSNEISLEDAIGCIGDNTELTLDNIVLAACEGNQVLVEKTMSKAAEEGINAITILRSLSRHLQRLHQAAAAKTKLGNAEKGLASLKPPVNFKQKDSYLRQLLSWTPTKITRAMAIVSEAEIDCKTTGMPADLICSRLLIRLGQAARR